MPSRLRRSKSRDGAGVILLGLLALALVSSRRPVRAATNNAQGAGGLPGGAGGSVGGGGGGGGSPGLPASLSPQTGSNGLPIASPGTLCLDAQGRPRPCGSSSISTVLTSTPAQAVQAALETIPAASGGVGARGVAPMMAAIARVAYAGGNAARTSRLRVVTGRVIKPQRIRFVSAAAPEVQILPRDELVTFTAAMPSIVTPAVVSGGGSAIYSK